MKALFRFTDGREVEMHVDTAASGRPYDSIYVDDPPNGRIRFDMNFPIWRSSPAESAPRLVYDQLRVRVR